MFDVGESIKVNVTLRDGYGVLRKQGGDMLRARIATPSLEAYAPGQVIDHNNASYTIVFRTIWPGLHTISISLAYKRETVRMLYKVRRKVIFC